MNTQIPQPLSSLHRFPLLHPTSLTPSLFQSHESPQQQQLILHPQQHSFMANTILLCGSPHFSKLPLLQWRKTPFPHSPSLTLKFPQIKHKPLPHTQPTSSNPLQLLLDSMNSLKKPAITLVLMALLLIPDPNSALAGTGGRMGGRSFSAAPPSRSYAAGRAGSAFSYTAPYYAPTPFGGGGLYVGPALGFGVGAGSSLLLVMAGFAAFVLVSGFLSDRSDGSVLTATEKTSVVKLQVGLLGMARTLQSDLNRIAETADTSTPQGLSYVLTETTLALLRHPDYCISAYSSADVKKSIEAGEKRFNQLSIEERGKFDEETLVNVNNIKRQSTNGVGASGFSNEYIVITILVAAEGVHKLPPINGSNDLKDALQKLGSIPSRQTMAVEVLWTPQDENDTLSERELLEDYPLLRPL